MGTKLGRIEKEFVLRGALDVGIKIQVRALHEELEGSILQYTDRDLVIELSGRATLKKEQEVRIYLFFQNNMHTFNARIKSVEENSITVEQPEGLYKSLQRKHERVPPPDGVTAFFTIKGQNVELSFPKTSLFRILERPEMDDTFDRSSIESLMRDFRNRAKEFASGSEIVILRNREPTTFEEKAMFQGGKILWLPSVDDGYPVDDPYPVERIFTKHDLLKMAGETDFSDTILSSRLDGILDKKFHAEIFSEIYCPMMYNQYFIGYIYLYNTIDRKEPLDDEAMEFTDQFSKVLCFSLEANGYFSSLANKERSMQTRIIDLSPSGMLFVHPQEDLSADLLVHTDLSVQLVTEKRKISIGARIARKYKDRDRLFLGLQFIQILPEDYRFIYELVYGKPFKDGYDDKWEGGIEPPELHLD